MRPGPGARALHPRYTGWVPVPSRHPSRHTFVAGVAVAAFAIVGCQARPSSEQSASAAKAAASQPADDDQQLPLRMRPDEIQGYLGGHPEALLLDVRDSTEWNDDMGHIPGSKMIPLGQLGGRLQEIEGWKDRPIIVISRLGDRGGAAVIVLREAGFHMVTGVDGGLEAWRKAGY